jgi:putative molybdopterin biosynthesis protein
MSTLTFSVNEVATQLRVGRTTVYRLLKSGQLPSFCIGRSRRVSAKSLQDYIEEMNS